MVIGITGGIGSGKTTIAGMFEKLGAYVINVDKVCHDVISHGQTAHQLIVKYFGREILNKDKTISRKKLSKIVFKNRLRLNRLNKIVHPIALKKIDDLLRKNTKRDIVVDAALLIEMGLHKKMDKLIVVSCKRREQINRVMKHRKMTEKEIMQRLTAQVALSKKISLADFIIDNNGTKTKTFIQVRSIWKNLRSSYGGK